jgi:6-phosphogluconolactonase (cycloisomerase 2 family)
MRKHAQLRQTTLLVELTVVLLFAVGCGTGHTKSAPATTYAYVLSSIYTSAPSNTSAVIDQFKMGSDGTLIPLTAATVPVADAAQSGVAVDPTGHYLFTYGGWSFGGAPIHQFVIGSDGTLTPNSVPSISNGSYPISFTFSPNGRFAIVPGADGTITSYSLDPSGSLTLINTLPGPIVGSSAVFDPTGTFVYVGGSGSIIEFTISSNGVLSPGVTYYTALGGALTLVPQGFLYSSGQADSQSALGEFTINQSNGGLSIVDTFPGSWSQVVFNPAGTYAYVNNGLIISAFKADPGTGALTSNGPNASTENLTIYSITVDPSGQFLFEAGDLYTGGETYQPEVIPVSINPDGTLGPMNSVSLADNVVPVAVAFASR